MFLGKIALFAVASTFLIGSAAGASKESKAATWYRHYFNVYIYAAYNKGAKEQNSTSPSTSTAGIRIEIAAFNHFDAKIQTIKFPSSDKGALNKVLSDNTVAVSLLGTLAVNTSSAANYNSIFPSVQTAEATSVAAMKALASKLGMNWS